ncbi:unnamed protein product [Amoebophrya sp. A25]|nr:unnamed protein product [Amoebophrya sp. A25]|eukprot:GSA25T00022761001.1
MTSVQMRMSLDDLRREAESITQYHRERASTADDLFVPAARAKGTIISSDLVEDLMAEKHRPSRDVENGITLSKSTSGTTSKARSIAGAGASQSSSPMKSRFSASVAKKKSMAGPGNTVSIRIDDTNTSSRGSSRSPSTTTKALLSTNTQMNARKSTRKSTRQGNRQTLSLKGAKSASSAESSPVRAENERQELLERGEELYRDITRLEQEKSVLQADVEQQKEHTLELERSNQELMSKVQKLEQAVKSGDPKGLARSIIDGEEKDMRKKIGTYASQIDSLRKENEAAATALKTAQAAAQQRVLERDSYFLTVEELEQNHLQLQQQYTKMESDAEAARAAKQNLETRLQEAQIELDVMQSSLKLARREAEMRVQQTENLEKATKEKNELIRHLSELIDPLRSVFLKLQRAYAQQTKEYATFVSEVEDKHSLGTGSLRVVKDEISVLETVVEHLRNELVETKGAMSMSTADLNARLAEEREKGSMQNLEIEKLKREAEEENKRVEQTLEEKRNELEALKRTMNRIHDRHEGVPRNPRDVNFAREVKTAANDGIVIDKISEKDGKQPGKTVFIDVSKAVLKYRRGFPRGGFTEVNLKEVMHMEWGEQSRAYAVGSKGNKMYKMLKPWLCFSLYTKERSWDFVVPDNDKSEPVLQTCLFALAAVFLGQNVGGNMIKTRGQFVWRKAMMKVDESSKLRGLTRQALVQEALLKTAAEQEAGIITAPARPKI